MYSYEQVNRNEQYVRSGRKQSLGMPLLFIWLLALISFSQPERGMTASVGSLDAIALAKLAVRAMGLLVLGIAIARSWGDPRRRVIAWGLWPLGLYTGWAILSTLWSPMKSFSLGQAGGLLVQVMLAFVIAMRCLDPRDTSKVLFHLTMVLLAYNTMVLIVHWISPEMSGLDRSIMGDIGGFVHPTAAGAAASLGMVVLVTSRLLWDWRWIKVLLVPGLVISFILLLLAESRTALGVGVVTLIFSLFMFSRRIILIMASVLVCILAILYLAADPGLDLAEKAVFSAGGHIRRGQSIEEMSSFTGRTELWEVVWDNYLESPLVGHGYLVGSRDGLVDVWGGPTYKTAHNVVMQVLVSTGLIGGILFLWAYLRPAAICVKVFPYDSVFRKQAAFLGVLGIWFLGWGMLCSSWIGPVRPESVLFYTLLGLAMSRIPANVR